MEEGERGLVKSGRWIFLEWGVGIRDRVDSVGGLEVNKLAEVLADDTT